MKFPSFLLASMLSLAVAARATVTEDFKQTYPLAADGVIRLENVNGDIDITAWDKNEVSVVAEKRAKTDEELKRVELIIEADPARLSIKTKYPKKSVWSLFGHWAQCTVRYQLMVPAGVRLEKIDTVNADITVSGVRGPVNLDTVNGSIKASGLAADARLDSVNGSLSAEFASLEGVKSVRLDSVNGRATITLPRGAAARIDADSVNGSIHVDQAIKLGKVRRHSLNGEIGSGGPDISIETVNGSITVREK